MWAIGPTTWPAARANSSMLAETYTTDSGQTTKLMEMVFTPTPRGQGMREAGRMTSSMATAWSTGQKEQSTRATIRSGSKTVLVSTLMQTGQCTRESGG